MKRPTDSLRPVGDDAAGPASGPLGMPPQTPPRPWVIAAIIAAVLVALIVLAGLVVVGIGSVLTLAGNPGDGAHSSETDDPSPSDPAPNPDTNDLEPSARMVESSLQATMDEYKSARDDGSLWLRIPDSDFNRTALSAFLYFLTDMKLAASFGGDTSDYLEQADDLEQKLLNQEPLGSDVSIKLSDRTFTYDGDTGEGGYTANN